MIILAMGMCRLLLYLVMGWHGSFSLLFMCWLLRPARAMSEQKSGCGLCQRVVLRCSRPNCSVRQRGNCVTCAGSGRRARHGGGAGSASGHVWIVRLQTRFRQSMLWHRLAIAGGAMIREDM